MPHLLLSFEVDGPANTLSLYLDYVARDDPVYVTGNNCLETFYKGPTREAAEAAMADPLVKSRCVDAWVRVCVA